MTTKTRILAGALAAMTAGGAMVAVAAEPASAHETTIGLRGGRAFVGASHVGVEVCSVEPGVAYEVQWKSSTGASRALRAPIDGGCSTFIDSRGIDRYRLCVVDYVCTAWVPT
jgi:hypothetical protein